MAGQDCFDLIDGNVDSVPSDLCLCCSRGSSSGADRSCLMVFGNINLYIHGHTHTLSLSLSLLFWHLQLILAVEK